MHTRRCLYTHSELILGTQEHYLLVCLPTTFSQPQDVTLGAEGPGPIPVTDKVKGRK